MKAIAALFAALLLSLSSSMPVAAQTDDAALVVFLVRHAEKLHDGNDPGLTAAGLARAEDLAGVLYEAGIQEIHSTNFRRTRLTAEPLAQDLGIEVSLYDGADLQGLMEAMKSSGGRHLVVGHSDTTPELVSLLGGNSGPPINEKSEYNRLYIVTVNDGGGISTTWIRYGD